jgi:hypothetical protein
LEDSFDALCPVGWFGAVAKGDGTAGGGVVLRGAGAPLTAHPQDAPWGWATGRGRGFLVGSLRPIRTAFKTLGGRTLERPSCGGLMPTAETTLFPDVVPGLR